MRLRRYVAMLAIAAGAGLALAPAAQAAVTENMSIPFSTFQPTAVNPCNGDTIALAGDVHVLISMTINGNQVSGNNLLQVQGGSGTDLTTGAEYRITGVIRDDFSTSFVNSQVVLTGVIAEGFIGHGSVPNFRVHENAHVVINANGTVTVNFDKLNVSCG